MPKPPVALVMAPTSTVSGPSSFAASRGTSCALAKHPIQVLPDETPSHPLVSSVDVASLCPRSETTLFPRREPAELKVGTINRV
jgi:hypothetical protein